jgi:hypothetical protein
VPGPGTRDQGRRELAAGDEPDGESSLPQSVVHVKRKHRHGDADDEKGDEDYAHDRQQARRDARGGNGSLRGCYGHALPFR